MLKTILLITLTLIKCYAMDAVVEGNERRDHTTSALNTAFQAAKYEKHIFKKWMFPDSTAMPINYEQSLDFISLMLEQADLERRLWNTSILGEEWETQRSEWQDLLLETRFDICQSKEKNTNWNNYIKSVRLIWKKYNECKCELINKYTDEKKCLAERNDESIESKLQLAYLREYVEFKYMYDVQIKRVTALSDQELKTLAVRQEKIERLKATQIREEAEAQRKTQQRKNH